MFPTLLRRVTCCAAVTMASSRRSLPPLALDPPGEPGLPVCCHFRFTREAVQTVRAGSGRATRKSSDDRSAFHFCLPSNFDISRPAAHPVFLVSTG